MKNKIINYSKTIGIDLIGFTDVKDFDQLRKKLEKQKELGYISNLQKGTIEERCNPKLILEDATSIIVIGIPYKNSDIRLENIKKEEVYFSPCSWGRDYHKVLNEKLNKIIEFIKIENPNANLVPIVDTSVMDDRFLAYKAGLGFYGKNKLLINEKYGSYFFIGSIITNIKIKKDYPVENKCLECNLCVKNCPLNALEEEILNVKKCLSYITQKKEKLNIKEKKAMNNCIYGCDICQKVCPYNKYDNTFETEFKVSNLEFINVYNYKPLSNKEFKNKYGELSGSWRGKKIIERNINIYKEKLEKENYNEKEE